MRLKVLLNLLLLILIVFSINVISATELTNESFVCHSNDFQEVNSVNIYETDDLDLSSNIHDQKLNDNDLDNSLVFHVNQNQTDDGEGSPDNPFKNLDLACQEVNNKNKNNVTLNIHDGIYYMGDNLDFNTSNLNIVGVDGNVIIKNGCPDRYKTSKQAFRLIPNEGNITFSNVIFDATSYTWKPYADSGGTNYFTPFYGEGKTVTFINCSFINFTTPINAISSNILNYYRFISCSLNFNVIKGGYTLFAYDSSKNKYFSGDMCPVFEYCSFNLGSTKGPFDISYLQLPCSIYMRDCWFGVNNLPSYVTNPNLVTEDGLNYVKDWSIPVNRYAQFSVSENYLGNNQWEIIGKLTWNGTDDQEGMENFQPMTVTLNSIGEIASTATLVNGTFRTIYTSSASTHHIETKLDKEENQQLDFVLVNINVTAPAIKYGEDQNITINFSQPINSTVVITVNNRNYTVKVNESSVVTYTIKYVNLTKGEYTVNVTLNDTGKHIYGSNSTTLSVSKVSAYTFNPVVPSEAKVGDTVNINVELPEDVTGNVTVYVNNNPITQQASKNTVIPITGLVAGNNEIIVFYEGNNKYENKTSAKQYITADKVSDYSFDVILPSNVKVGDNPSITIKLPNDAKGNAIVYVGTQAGKSVPVTSGSTNVSISGLIAGNNSIKVVFSDNRYEEKTITKNLTVEKVSAYDFKVTLPTNVKVGDRANVVINLPDDASGNLTVYLGETPFKTTVNGNTTIVPISGFVEGNNNISVVYEGNGKYVGKTFNGNITVTKVTDYSFDVTLPTGTIRVGDNPEIVINLPDDVNGSAIVYVGNQDGLIVPVTTNSTNVPISGLIAGNNTIKVVFTDKKYGEKTITKNLTVNKVNEYTFNVVLPTGVKMGDTANVVINLPDDASGNVTVYLGETPFKDTANGNTISVPISGFVEGNNNISVVYEGNGKYVGKTFNGNISVDKKPVEITNNTIVVDTPKDTTAPSVSINLPQGATGNLTVIVNGKPYTKELVNGSATITITDLPAGTYNATVIYSGDKIYDSINTTATITVSESKKQNTNTNTNTNTKKTTKVATKIIAKNKTYKAKTKVKKYTITLKTKAGKAVKKVQVTLKIKGKTYKAKTNAKGKATFKIKKFTKKGKHKAVIKFAGNKNYKACSKKVKITIKK